MAFRADCNHIFRHSQASVGVESNVVSVQPYTVLAAGHGALIPIAPEQLSALSWCRLARPRVDDLDFRLAGTDLRPGIDHVSPPQIFDCVPTDPLELSLI